MSTLLSFCWFSREFIGLFKDSLINNHYFTIFALIRIFKFILNSIFNTCLVVFFK